MKHVLLQLHHRLTNKLAVDHVTVGLGQLLHPLDQNVVALHVQRPHLHEHLYSLVEVLVVVQDALQLNPLRNDVLEVLNAFLAAPVIVSGGGPAHDHLGVVGHHVQHTAQHVLSHVLVVDVTFLSSHHFLYVVFELLGPDDVLVIVLFVVETVLTA